MTATTGDILLLTLLACGVLLALTVFSEVLRARMGTHPAVQTFTTRVESWWAMVILFALSLAIGPLGIVALVGFGAFAALREYTTYSHKDQADHLALAIGFYLVLPAQFVFVYMDWPGLFTVFIPVYVFLLLPVVSVLRGDTGGFLARVTKMQWGLMICVYALSHLPALMWLHVGARQERMVLLIAFLVVVVQSADLVDFFLGRRFGRRRIVAGLSPKTWEGLVLSLIFAAGMGAALHWITPFGPLEAAGMAVIASATGACGALVLTAIKRDAGVRDWSHLIPGQGGFLDQLDSVIFAAPVFFHLTLLGWT
jgi:phosphatidate cytidylyltransferase